MHHRGEDLMLEIVDPGVDRLSRSRVWELQRRYFMEQGPRAWSSGTVPHYVTSNPFLARAFAEVVLGFASDLARPAAGEARPLYIVELGAGTGRLGYHLVRALGAMCDLERAGWRPVYVLTDLSERTIAWWQAHPWLQPLIAAGVVDVARFDLSCDTELSLRGSGRVLSPADPAGELVVVANYVFDSLPQDAFVGAGGALSEYVAAPADVSAEVGGAGFSAADLRYYERPLDGADYYGDAVHDQILAGYRGVEGTFTFPCVALGALDRLRALCRGPMLLLSADKGGARLDDVIAADATAFALHGSLSMTVNYHAIGQWAVAHGGSWLHADHRSRVLEVCAFVLGVADGRGTLAAYDRAIAQRGPDDFYAIKQVIARRDDELELGELLAYLRMSGHDAKLFLDCAPAVRAAAARAGAKDDLMAAIARIWDGYFPIGEPRDLAGALGALAHDLGRWREAAAFFEASIALHGESPDVCCKLAACHAELDEPGPAARWLARAFLLQQAVG